MEGRRVQSARQRRIIKLWIMRQTDYRGAAVRAPTIKRFVGPILVYRLIKSGSRREHAARIDNGCLIARKARHRDEQLGDMNRPHDRSEEHTSELQSLMRISYAVFCLKKKKINNPPRRHIHIKHIQTYHYYTPT